MAGRVTVPRRTAHWKVSKGHESRYCQRGRIAKYTLSRLGFLIMGEYFARSSKTHEQD